MAYGSILVCGDYEGNLDGIVRVLNQWAWDSDDDVKFVARDGQIYTNIETACYPTMQPSRFFDSNDPEQIALETIIEQICPFLKNGTLELVALASERAAFGYVERLVIRADGSGELHGYAFDTGAVEDWSRYAVVKYDSKTSGKHGAPVP